MRVRMYSSVNPHLLIDAVANGADNQGRSRIPDSRDEEGEDAAGNARVDIGNHAGELGGIERHLAAKGGGEHDGDQQVGHG